MTIIHTDKERGYVIYCNVGSLNLLVSEYCNCLNNFIMVFILLPIC